MKASNRTAVVLAVAAAAVLAWWVLRGDPFASPGGGEEPAPASPVAEEQAKRPLFPRPGPPRPEVPRTPSGPGSAPVPAVPAPAAAAAPKPREDLPEGPAAAGEVVGVVLLLPERTPVPGATVRLVGGGPGREVAPYPDPSSATTGENGIFRIAGFAPGNYLFEASAQGRSPRLFRATVPEGRGVDGIEILLGGGGAVEGRVDGASGPESGVRVRINRSGIGGGRGLLSCTTDTGGMYRFEDLPPRHYSVEVDGKGPIGGRVGSVDVVAGETARLDFPAGASMGGSVQDEDRAPLADAIVRVVRIVGGTYGSTQTRTGKDSSYRIDALEPGSAQVQIQVTGEGGFSVNVAELDLAPGENRVDLQLGQGEVSGAITGRVFARSTGAPVGVNDGQVTLYAAEEKDGASGPANRWWGLAFPDAQGRFRFPALRAGRYRLYVQSFRGLAGTEMEIVLAAGERRTGLEFGLEPFVPRERPPSAASLSGAVTDEEGRPLSGAYVRLHAAADLETSRQGVADESGRYHVEGLDPGDWKVTVQVVGTDGFALEVAETAIRAGENSLDIRLGKGELAGEIRGRVFVAATRRPLSSREVHVSLGAIQPDGSHRFGSSAWADAEGAFRFPYLRGGRYRLVASPMVGGLAQKELEVACAPGEKVSGVEVALDELRTGKVRFTVRDPEGKPVLLVSIESLKDGKRQQGSMSANSQDGIYETNFEVGTHAVKVRDLAGRLAADLTVEVRDGETARVDVVLRPTQEPK